ncbi:MAG: recombinase family protein [Candidatus Methanomethylicaceae archaeon]
MNTRYSPKQVRRPRGRPSKSHLLRCFGYARVSTIKQIEAPGGIKAQVDKIKRFCQMQGWQLLKVFKDEGVSALDERPAFTQLMKAIAKKEVDAVIVTRLDRLGRSVLDLVSTVTEFQRQGCQFIAIEQAIDTTKPEGRLLFNILSAFAEFEREIIRERMLAGRMRAREQGVIDHRPKLNIPLDELKDLYFNRKLSVSACAKYFRCSRMTIYERLKEIRKAQT